MSEVDTGDDPRSVALDPVNALPRRIAEWVSVDPDRPFLVEAASGRTRTYREFWVEVCQWATLLEQSGVGPGGRVITMLPSSIESHAVWLAASIIGAAEVPVNPELRGDFLDHVLTDACADLCVTRPEFASVIHSSGIDHLTLLVASVDAPLTSEIRPKAVDRLPGPEDVSCVIYTSGTTGPAKGVMISWAQMSAVIGRIPRAWLSADDAVYSPWPMFHVTGRSPMMSMADVGGRLVLREKFSLDDFWPDIRTHRCTSTTVSAVQGLLLAQPERSDDADNPLRISLLGQVGDDGLRFLERFDSMGMCFYGSTELGFPIANRRVTPDTKRVIGWARPGYATRVVDPDGNDTDPGSAGELWVRPPDRRLMFIEYLNHPERTAEAVVDGWYRTGDAVRQRADGAFEFVDRMRDTIRRFGENISSTALEASVMADDQVLECAVVGIPSAITGQDVLIVVVPTPGAELDPGALAERLEQRLPRYMRPSYISVVDQLEKTPTGKIRKVDLGDSVDLASVWRAG